MIQWLVQKIYSYSWEPGYQLRLGELLLVTKTGSKIYKIINVLKLIFRLTFLKLICSAYIHVVGSMVNMYMLLYKLFLTFVCCIIYNAWLCPTWMTVLTSSRNWHFWNTLDGKKTRNNMNSKSLTANNGK